MRLSPLLLNAFLCCHLLHLLEVLQPSFDPAAKPSLQSIFSLACWGSPSHSGGLFLQERYCLALGEEELAELRLFCAQRRREALGQGVACLVPPKLEERTCEKVCSPRPQYSPSSALCPLTSAEWASFWDSGGRKGFGD